MNENGERDESGEAAGSAGSAEIGEDGACDECGAYGESVPRGEGVRRGARGGGRGPVVTLEEAEKVCAELDAALRAAGIKLPSLWIEATTYANDYLPPLVQLGRCDVDTARALLAVARAAPGRTEATSTPV